MEAVHSVRWNWMVEESTMSLRRYDLSGRDVTDLPGLWDESDVFAEESDMFGSCERCGCDLEADQDEYCDQCRWWMEQ